MNKTKKPLSKYLIKYKIITPAELIKPFIYKGYEFTSYEKSFWEGDAWVASKVVTGENSSSAYQKFVKGLLPCIDKLSTISQCSFNPLIGTFIIYKLNSNPQKIVYVKYIKPRGTTGLHFDKPEIDQLKRLNNASKQGLFFLSEAARATTYYTRIAMLLSSVEGFAGEVIKNGRPHTNTEELKSIYGTKLYKRLYMTGAGLRHDIAHGKKIRHKAFQGLGQEIYTSLTSYLNKKFSLYINADNVVGPQRTFNVNYVYLVVYMKYINQPVLDIKEIEELMRMWDNGERTKTKEVWSFVPPDQIDKY